MGLIELVRAAVPEPLTELGTAAVTAYAALPGVTPPATDFHFGNALDVLQEGWPLAVLGHTQGLERLVRKANGGKFDPSDLSVIHVGAMLRRLGADVEFLPEQTNKRTPDLRASWTGKTVDVEVATAAVKAQQDALDEVMKDIRDAIGRVDAECHFLVLLADLPDARTVTEIKATILSLTCGCERVTDQWAVYAVSREQFASLEGKESLRPGWREDGPTRVIMGAMVGGTEGGRQFRIESKVPFLSYLNQVRAKADRPQGDPEKPFLVVLDQGSGGALPLRHGKWSSGLSEWWPNWPHVSGVLCFYRFASVDGSFCWRVSFHPNPKAARPLPAALLGLAPDTTISTIVFGQKAQT